jgi:hypothetical protein
VPTKRVRTDRTPVAYLGELLDVEENWLLGREQPWGNGRRFWSHAGGRRKAERCRFLIEQYRDVIPPERLPRLLRDVEKWAAASWE